MSSFEELLYTDYCIEEKEKEKMAIEREREILLQKSFDIQREIDNIKGQRKTLIKEILIVNKT